MVQNFPFSVFSGVWISSQLSWKKYGVIFILLTSTSEFLALLVGYSTGLMDFDTNYLISKWFILILFYLPVSIAMVIKLCSLSAKSTNDKSTVDCVSEFSVAMSSFHSHESSINLYQTNAVPFEVISHSSQMSDWSTLRRRFYLGLLSLLTFGFSSLGYLLFISSTNMCDYMEGMGFCYTSQIETSHMFWFVGHLAIIPIGVFVIWCRPQGCWLLLIILVIVCIFGVIQYFPFLLFQQPWLLYLFAFSNSFTHLLTPLTLFYVQNRLASSCTPGTMFCLAQVHNIGKDVPFILVLFVSETHKIYPSVCLIDVSLVAFLLLLLCALIERKT